MAEQNTKEKKHKLGKTFIYLILLVVLLILVNPNLYFFLSKEKRDAVAVVLKDLFGDFSKMGSGLNLNLVAIVQLAIMILLLLFIN